MITDESPNNKIYKAILPEHVDSSSTPLSFTTVYTFDGGISSRGLAFDPVEKMLYWADYDTYVIARCDLNGGNYKELYVSSGKFQMCISS